MLTRLDHPLIADRLGRLRDKNTSSALFRRIMEELGVYLAYEVSRHLQVGAGEVQTPIAVARIQRVTESPIIAPILRAGLAFLPGFQQAFAEAPVAHLGFYRDPDTLSPVCYYMNMPAEPGKRQIYLLDPMLATGHSAGAALAALQQAGASKIMLISLLAAPEGIAYLSQRFPTVQIVTTAIDDGLDENGYIIPGLGDAGDRIFGTPHSAPKTLLAPASH